MRRFARFAATTVVMGAFLGGASSALADGIAGLSLADPNGATVLQDVECGIPSVGVTSSSLFVFTPSGNATLVCRGDTSAPPPQAEVITGFTCSLGPAGSTSDSRVVITPSGQATMTCHKNGSTT